MFSRSVQNLIRNRISTRTYSRSRQIEESKLDALLEFCLSLCPSPFGDKARFFISNTAQPGKPKLHIGTYGSIRNAAAFISGSIEKSERCYESFGYLFEHVILKATDLGFSTCWLGVFDLPDEIVLPNVKNKEIIPAISPIGYKSSSPVTKDIIMRNIARVTRRKQFSELFFNCDFDNPLDEEKAGIYSTPLEMVRLGPSAGNKQPWRVVMDEDILHFYIDMSSVPENYRNLSLHLLDLGIALSHFELTCLELKIQGRYISLNPESRPECPKHHRYGISWKRE